MRKTAVLAMLGVAAWACAGTNLARNPSFESDANSDGAPDEWQSAGDSRLVTQSLALDKGRDGTRCAKLACTKFAAGNPAAHAMLAQLGIPVKRGTNYRVSFWARAENIEADTVSIALSDTSVWAPCGLGGAFAPSADWQRFEFFFQAKRDCPEKSRFQLWFGSTGTLWLDDVEFAEAGPQARRPGHIIPSAGKKNLIPNASFEVGTDGWGSAGSGSGASWATPMNALFGVLDEKGAFHGKRSLRIDLSPETVPVAYFDYYGLTRSPVWAPLAANIGWIEVEPGNPYTLSTYLKADKAGVPARLAIHEFERGQFDKLVAVSTKWERYSLTFTPRQHWCFVAVGPDLRKSQENPNPPDRATLWLDAVQLERGEAPAAFGPRDAVEAIAVPGAPDRERTLQLASAHLYKGADSRFGVNHAYPWPHLLDNCRKAGLIWVRDWSLKWQEVEPEKGKFNFTETGYQIDRPIKHGLKVLGLLPFPSANWASSAPESVKATDRYPGNRARVAYAPRDVAEFENYVAKTVERYKGRITWWQCFNEPVFTDYSLPRKHGYTAKDYAKWTLAFARAAKRANPDCKILAGMGYISEGQIMKDFGEFFAAGGLAVCDAVDIHHYPRIRPPEFIEPLLEKLNALMDKHGRRKPLWLTEYGYYAEDEPWIVPLPHHDFDQPLPSERVQAEYAVRWATLCFANGVDKVFYHAGTCGGINSGSLQGVFFGYGGQPRKIYAAQAVMAHLLTPTCRFVKKLSLGEGVRAYLFRDGQQLVCVVWAPKAVPPRPIKLAGDKLVLWDIMGRPQSAREFTPSGTPVYLLADGLTEAAFEAAIK
ncbi:MAG TPA: carbohydrate binding domain-containing protein [Planctomycetota bacterium]|nr:carbohydrate binding domain-containing protein [Planctomycetota bacterium]